MRRKIDNIISRLSKPFSNNKAIGALDLILAIIVMITVASLWVYGQACLEQESVRNNLNSEANAMVDVITENRQINEPINSYFQDSLKGSSFYVSDYKIVYNVYDFTPSGFSSSQSVTVARGTQAPTIKLTKGQLVKVYIQSTNETFLTRATKFLGGTQATDVIGFAEGGVN